MITAIITARGGSKRFPGKNIAKLNGKPLIVWTIEAALKSKVFNRVLVSTDDKHIARISERAGAEIPFLRPRHLAGDKSTHFSVIEHTLQFLAKNAALPEAFMLLQPTSPLRDADDIRKALALYKTKKAEAVVSVRLVKDHPYLVREMQSNGTLKKWFKDKLVYRRAQDLPALFRPNGALYLVNSKAFLKQNNFFPKNTYPLVMTNAKSLDIDTPDDLKLAQFFLKRRA